MRRLGGRVMSARPRVVVFDLDGCVWYPEMYHLWGGGGAPFKQAAGGDLTDNAGTNVRLMGDVRAIMTSLHRDAQWKGTAVAVASCRSKAAPASPTSWRMCRSERLRRRCTCGRSQRRLAAGLKR
eukprot:TRINITY_DN13473_c0_g1_i1.p2 TRINITY_DN13473_c0_g1~~TRINITY_DN13473_c0_g1_i1.p2  ORF type:complete len:125 (+),score=19.29 TRINITY_DN13473_c0_g1_i1:28-402(+)